MVWNWSPVFADLAEAWFALLQESGEEAAARQVLSHHQKGFKLFRETGTVQTKWDNSIDYQEGRGLYMAG